MTVVDDRLGISVGAPEIGPDMRQLWDRFPPETREGNWPATEGPSESVLAEMIAASCNLDETGAQQRRRLGMVRLLGWLSKRPVTLGNSGGSPAGRTPGTRIGGSRCWRGHALRGPTAG